MRLLAVVADALDAAHAANLVHRDIKPSNLLVTDAGTAAESVTLVDFGISRRYDTDSDITRTGEIVGTIAYCAPEQLSGDRRGRGVRPVRAGLRGVRVPDRLGAVSRGRASWRW